jgi:uncharacterized protein involved in exopolysaccharide biosynthesis
MQAQLQPPVMPLRSGTATRAPRRPARPVDAIDGWPRRRRYLLAALCANLMVWTAAGAVIQLWPKSYAVESSLILPSSDPDARVDLKDVGQAYATSRSTYDAKSLDPRVNYKEIMLSANVIDSAAALLKMDPAAFGQPRVKLIDQSSIMEVTVKARTRELALAKSVQLHKSFHQRVNELRQDELAQREQAIDQAVRASREKLNQAQQELVKFKVDSQIVTDKQLDEMALASTSLQRRVIELGQKVAHDRATAASLSAQLGIAPRLAGWTLTLQGDAVFLEHFRQFAAASSQLSDFNHKWESTHPKVREATGQRESALSAMLARARMVLGEAVSPLDLRRLALVLQDRSRDQLLRELVAAQAAVESSLAEMAEIDRQQRRLAEALPKLASESARLDELQRRVNFSEAVFTGTVGKTDVGISNIFASYPMVQTLVAPSMPDGPASPRMAYVAAGAMVASLLLTVGLALAWMRSKS